MSEFRQPGVWLYKTEEPPVVAFSLEHLRRLAKLSTEEVTQVLAPITDVRQRLEVVRGIQDIRIGERAENDFEDDVELQRARKRARKEADRRDHDERDAYLTSEEGLSEAAAQFESELIDLDDLEDLEPLIDGFLYRETMVRTFGPPKSLKSFVTLDMAACVSLGMEWQGRATVQTTVLYVVAEGLRGVKKRRNAWNEYHNTEMKVIFYPRAVQIGDQEEMFRLIAFCRLKQVGYVVFDTQARCTVGVDENDNSENGEIVASLDILKRETGACVHLVHHSVGSNDQKARGATAWDGAVDAEFFTKRDKAVREHVELVTKFQKDMPESEPVLLLAVECGPSLVMELRGGGEGGSGGTGDVAPALVSDPNAFYLEAIRAFGSQGVSVTDVVNDFKERGIDRSRSSIKKAFGVLEGNGAVAQVGQGTSVTITQAGLVFSDGYRKRAPVDGLDQGVIQGVA